MSHKNKCCLLFTFLLLSDRPSVSPFQGGDAVVAPGGGLHGVDDPHVEECEDTQWEQPWPERRVRQSVINYK